MTSHYRGSKISEFQTTFLDRDDHLHCRTMEEKYGLPFFVFFSVIFAGPRSVKILEFCYHGNMT